MFQLWYSIIAFFRTYNSWLVNTAATLLEKHCTRLSAQGSNVKLEKSVTAEWTWTPNILWECTVTKTSVSSSHEKRRAKTNILENWLSTSFCIFSYVLTKLINQRHFFHPNAICHGIYCTVGIVCHQLLNCGVIVISSFGISKAIMS